MTTTEVLDVVYTTFSMALRIALPLLLVSMVIGIIVAIFQAATQINEQTLTFVPKLVSIVALLAILGSTMLAQMKDFFISICHMIAAG